MEIKKTNITGLILAGGRGTRMGEVNKGLQLLQQRPLVTWALDRIQAQVDTLIINANQDLVHYQALGFPVIEDRIPNYAGPLAGIHAGLKACKTDYLISVPCDSPFLPEDLVSRLVQAMIEEETEISVAYTLEMRNGETHKQVHPVFSLINKKCLESLEYFLMQGERKIRAWHAQHRVSEVHFENVQAFINVNTTDQLQHIENSTTV